MDQILSSSQRLLRWAQFDEHFFSGVGFASWIYLLLSPMAVNAFFYLTSRSCTGSNSSASGSPADPSCAPWPELLWIRPGEGVCRARSLRASHFFHSARL